jgi:hypothetical protein
MSTHLLQASNAGHFDYRAGILLSVSVVAIVALLFMGPIPQDPAYHHFADTRAIGGIDNFWNVVSNFPFLWAGLYGFGRVRNLEIRESMSGYVALCAGVLLVGIGSSYYHFSPSTPSLLWDRLPMTVAFMALFSIVLDERKVLGSAVGTLWPLVILGICSALYWSWTESLGRGDLRPYILVQFLPILLIPLVLLLFRGRYLKNTALVIALMLYLAAKALEQFDRAVYAAIGVLSGHTLKHLLAALAVFYIIKAVPADKVNRRIESDRI